MKIRVQIFDKVHEITGFKRSHLKLSFLNHSKWNQNEYNNFAVEYFVDSKDDEDRSKTFKRAEESEIIWGVE